LLADLVMLEDDRVLAVGGDALDAEPVARDALEPSMHLRKVRMVYSQVPRAPQRGDKLTREER
jgi:hypothetical protein